MRSVIAYITHVCFFERLLTILALGFLLNATFPDVYFEIGVLEFEELEDREKEEGHEKKCQSSNDEIGNFHVLRNDTGYVSFLNLSYQNDLCLNYKNCYYRIIIPPPKLMA